MGGLGFRVEVVNGLISRRTPTRRLIPPFVKYSLSALGLSTLNGSFQFVFHLLVQYP